MEYIIENKTFKFRRAQFLQLNNETLELPVSEHIDEIRQRVFHSGGFLILGLCVIFFNITHLVKILETPVQGIKFIQLAPGEYFLSTVKIASYGGLLFTLPFLISQIMFYVLPGLTKSEKDIILPILLSSFSLFCLGLLFAYYILIPAALSFFIGYSTDVIEPIWSFDQYFDFVSFIFYSTGLSFQIPILQIILGLAGIVSGQKMLTLWRYVVLFSTILSAVLTPSTDPVTQICLALAILFLYLTGAGILIYFNK